jgi:hypothetical protein
LLPDGFIFYYELSIHTLETGWYSPDLDISSGGVFIEYWNGVVNKYSPRGIVDPNDASLYTAEHYITCLNLYLERLSESGRRAFIELPIGQVWNMADWEPARWTAQIVSAVHGQKACAGFYIGDEPEVWGYSSANTFPVLTADFMKARYKTVKAITDKPVLAVFVDPPLMRDRYGTVLNPSDRFFDIFGFDNYPFEKDRELNWSRVNSKLLDMKALWDACGSPPLMYVGQGCGNVNLSGQPNFGQRNPSSEELDEMLGRVKGIFGNLDYYLLWSWQYADQYMHALGNVHLETVSDVVSIGPELSWFRKLLKRVFGI